MTQPFTLAACAEMLWRDRPMEWRVKRLTEMGFGVGLWNWPEHDLDMLERSGATFTIMNGYLRGRLADDEGATELLATARETAAVGKRLGVHRLNLHGTGLGEGGLPVTPVEVVTGEMWLKALGTLNRIADLADELDVTFTLENLNLAVDHPGVPFARAEDTLALVSAVDRPGLKMNLDLYHAQIGEGNLIDLCRRSLPWIGEIQVATYQVASSPEPAKSTSQGSPERWPTWDIAERSGWNPSPRVIPKTRSTLSARPSRCDLNLYNGRNMVRRSSIL